MAVKNSQPGGPAGGHIGLPTAGQKAELSQRDRFIEIARALECDEDEAAFDEKLKAIAGQKPKAACGPIACILGLGDLRQRMSWIAELNRKSLKASHLNGLALTLSYERSAVSEVKELVRREQECCAFLVFDLQQSEDAITLTIAAPEEAREAAEPLLEHFSAR